jgi:hypothetical protein
MRHLRRIFLASLFTFALVSPALAGQIEIGYQPPPPPAQTVTANGGIQTGVTGQMDTDSGETTIADSATELALNLLQSVLSLF